VGVALAPFNEKCLEWRYETVKDADQEGKNGDNTPCWYENLPKNANGEKISLEASYLFRPTFDTKSSLCLFRVKRYPDKSQEFESPVCARQPSALYDKRSLEMFESIAICEVMNIQEWENAVPFEEENENKKNFTFVGCSNNNMTTMSDPGLYCDLSLHIREPSPQGILDMPVSFWNTYYFPRGEKDVMELSQHAGTIHKGGEAP